MKKHTDTLASNEEERQKLVASKTSAEKALTELTGERQKILDDHATRIRELEAAHNAVKFDADKHVGELKAQVRQADEDLLVRVRQLSDVTVAKAASDRRGVDLGHPFPHASLVYTYHMIPPCLLPISHTFVVYCYLYHIVTSLLGPPLTSPTVVHS